MSPQPQEGIGLLLIFPGPLPKTPLRPPPSLGAHLKLDNPTFLLSTWGPLGKEGPGSEVDSRGCPAHLCLVSSAGGFRGTQQPGRGNWLMKAAGRWRGKGSGEEGDGP